MQATELINLCKQENRLTLSEAESKQILNTFDIPVVHELVATTHAETLKMAQQIGYPLVLKGLGSSLTHKTEMGLVRLGLKNDDEVIEAFDEVKNAAGPGWEGCLLQPMVSGRREFVAGIIRDPQFGPMIMFGLGGIFTEAVDDVVFRIAPINRKQALQMTEDLASNSLLKAFRGEEAVNTDQLCNVLTGLSRLAMEHPEIEEVDINPLIVDARGDMTAVDALIVLNDGKTTLPEEPSDEEQAGRTARINADLDRALHAKSVAVVGVARTKPAAFPGIFRCMRNYGYAGKLYPIHPDADDIEGIKAYPSLNALPGPVDLVILSIPAEQVPETLRECAALGNKNIHIFTSGFNETGEEEGARLHAEIKKIADDNNLNVIGPNCMGLHVPASKMLTWTHASPVSGHVAMVSQSGGNAQDFTNFATTHHGLHFSKVISYGNALNLDSTDYLNYLARDDETSIITMYLEGVKDGRKLARTVYDINRTKPIVMIKGGLSESGARTVASHTGALAGGEKMWKAFFRQTGAVQANTLEEMADVVSALHHLPPCEGRGVTILGNGGGIGVAAADSCHKAGLEMPALSPTVIKKLREYIPPAGNMIQNPLDAYIVLVNLKLFGPTLQLLADEPDINMFIISLHLDWFYVIEEGKQIYRIADYLVNEARKYTNGKPLVAVWRQYQPSPQIKEARKRYEKILLEGGIPLYEGLDRALWALSKACDYYSFKKSCSQN